MQIEGIASKVPESEQQKVIKTYFSRKFPYGTISGEFAEGFKKLLKDKVYSFYKIVPTKVWINNPNVEYDERVEINLNAK